jgi:hypothetical protein
MSDQDALDQAGYREARLDEYISRAARAGGMSRRRFLEALALAAGLRLPAAEANAALARSAVGQSAISCGDAAGAPHSLDCPGDRLIAKPTPAERFRILGAGSAEMRWDRLAAGDYLVPTRDLEADGRRRCAAPAADLDL